MPQPVNLPYPTELKPSKLKLSLWLAVLLLLLSGCAATPGPRVEHDPWESYNRGAQKFNDKVDRAVFKPVAKGYDALLPGFAKKGIANFFSNLDDLVVTANDLLQLKGKRTLADGGRFLINTTVGILGLFDPATAMGLEKHSEDFGQTLGRWGVGSGPYLVLPFLGPSTLRDAPAIYVDGQIDPVYRIRPEEARYGFTLLELVSFRAALLGTIDILETAALDPYTFTREAFLQRRKNLVYDGDPPPDAQDDPDELDPLDELDELDDLDALDDDMPDGNQADELDQLDRLDAEDPSKP